MACWSTPSPRSPEHRPLARPPRQLAGTQADRGPTRPAGGGRGGGPHRATAGLRRRLLLPGGYPQPQRWRRDGVTTCRPPDSGTIRWCDPLGLVVGSWMDWRVVITTHRSPLDSEPVAALRAARGWIRVPAWTSSPRSHRVRALFEMGRGAGAAAGRLLPRRTSSTPTAWQPTTCWLGCGTACRPVGGAHPGDLGSPPRLLTL